MSAMLTYEGKRVAICGCRSGIGYETTKLLLAHGAEVIGLDVGPTDLPVAQFIQLDLAQEPTIVAAIEAIDGTIDSLITTSAIPHIVNPGINCQIVNFVGLRRLVEGLIPRINRGGAIAITSSGAVPATRNTCRSYSIW
jgi:NAD(P)-dependent dehydrogenase (short-subunit alcohol dehydrogenase family)